MHFFGSVSSNVLGHKNNDVPEEPDCAGNFQVVPTDKKKLWGGEFWTDGYFSSTVGKHGDEHMIRKYVKNQGNEYAKLYEDRQNSIF